MNNQIWKIGKQYAELSAALTALEKIADFGVLSHKDSNQLLDSRTIIRQAIDRLAQKMEEINDETA